MEPHLPPPSHISRSSSVLLKLMYALATSLIILAILYIFLEQAPQALPDNAPEPFRHQNMDAKSAAASALKDVISLLTTLSLGLSGIIGFAVRDRLKTFDILSGINCLLLSIYICLLIFSLTKAYHAHAMMAAQLAEGHFFYARVSELVEAQAVSLVVSATIVVIVLVLSVGSNYRRSA